MCKGNVSEIHAIFELTETGVQLTDNDSKHGVFISNDTAQFQRIPANQPVELQLNDVIHIGKKNNVIQLNKMNIKVCESRLKDSDKQKLKEIMLNVNGTWLENYDSECTHLVMEKLYVSSRMMEAYAHGTPTVSLAFWLKFIENARQGIALPNAKDFTPKLTKPYMLALPSGAIANKDRQHLFAKKTFVFLDEVQKNGFNTIVKLAGGKSIAMDPHQPDHGYLLHNECIPIDYKAEDDSTLAADIEAIKNYLAENGRNMIDQSEIAQAIWLNSVDVYCNPNFTVDSQSSPPPPPPPSLSPKQQVLKVLHEYYDVFESNQRYDIINFYAEESTGSYQKSLNDKSMEKLLSHTDIADRIFRFRQIEKFVNLGMYDTVISPDTIRYSTIGQIQFKNADEPNEFSQQLVFKFSNDQWLIVQDTFCYMYRSNDVKVDKVNEVVQTMSQMSLTDEPLAVSPYIGCGFSNPPCNELNKGPWSCYINAAIQALLHMPAFTKMIEEDRTHRNNNPNCNCFACEFFGIYMKTNEPNADGFIENIFRKRIKDVSNLLFEGDHDDSELFLSALFEKMVTQFAARSPPQQQMNELFQGTVKQTYTCQKCLNSHEVEDTFHTIRLRINQKPRDVKQAITQNEQRTETDLCRSCQESTEFQVHQSWPTVPKFLCIAFDRYPVGCGTTLVNHPIVPSQSIKFTTDQGVQWFKLTSSVQHTGELNSGHYTTLAKIEDAIYKFDDKSVTQVAKMSKLASYLMYEQTNETDCCDDENSDDVPVLALMEYGDFDDDFCNSGMQTPTPTAVVAPPPLFLAAAKLAAAKSTGSTATQSKAATKRRKAKTKAILPKPRKVAKIKTQVNKRKKGHISKINCYTIKRSLHAMCKSIQMLNVIKYAVRNVSKIMKLASLNIHHSVYDAITRKNSELLNEIFGGKGVNIIRFYMEVGEIELSQTTTATRLRKARRGGKEPPKYHFTPFTNLMKKLRVQRVRRNLLTHLIDNARQKYITNLHINLKCHGENYIKRLFKLYYAKSDSEVDKKTVEQTTGWLFTEGGEPDDDLLDFLFDTMDLEKYPEKGMFQELHHQDLWFHHVVGFINIQLAIYDYNQTVKNHEQIKNFTVLPIHRVGAEKHILLDTHALIYLHNDAYPGSKVPLSLSSRTKQKMTEKNKKQLWAKCFRLNALSKTAQRRFNCYATVNSWSINLCFSRPPNIREKRIVPKTTKDYAKANEPVENEVKEGIKNDAFGSIIGGDLGARVAISCVELNPAEKTETNFAITNKKWQQWTQSEKFDHELKKIQRKYLAFVRSEQVNLFKRNGERYRCAVINDLMLISY